MLVDFIMVTFDWLVVGRIEVKIAEVVEFLIVVNERVEFIEVVNELLIVELD